MLSIQVIAGSLVITWVRSMMMIRWPVVIQAILFQSPMQVHQKNLMKKCHTWNRLRTGRRLSLVLFWFSPSWFFSAQINWHACECTPMFNMPESPLTQFLIVSDGTQDCPSTSSRDSSHSYDRADPLMHIELCSEQVTPHHIKGIGSWKLAQYNLPKISSNSF
mgnify:CR=1 FL=1